jgi:1-acyl-sn-glycerol-3-phosphate acyltransferase
MGICYFIFYHLTRLIAYVFYGYRVINGNVLDNIPQGEGALIASNHVSFLDPPLVGAALDYGAYYLARKSLWSNPVASFIYDRLQALPVDQDKPEFGTLKKIIKLARNGEKVIIFPEGERTLTGEFGKGLPGVGLMIAKSGVPVVPVRLFGAYEALPRGKSLPRPSKITLVVGQPIIFTKEELAAKDRDAYAALSQRVMDEIAKLEIDVSA